MEFIAREGLSETQIAILELRANKKTYKDIIGFILDNNHRYISDKLLVTILSRSALGYYWDFDINGGPLPYLCQEDLNSLKRSITECAEIGASMDSIEVIDEAVRLKTERKCFSSGFFIL